MTYNINKEEKSSALEYHDFAPWLLSNEQKDKIEKEKKERELEQEEEEMSVIGNLIHSSYNKGNSDG